MEKKVQSAECRVQSYKRCKASVGEFAVLFFLLCECFFEGGAGETFFLEKSFPRILFLKPQKTKKRIWFTNPLFALFGN
jgi:hypothetical protein